MGYESIAHEAEGRIGYWLRGHEGERNNCFSKIQLVGQKNIETKHLSLWSIIEQTHGNMEFFVKYPWTGSNLIVIDNM